MLFTFYDLLLVIGCIQGLFTAFLLRHTESNLTGNRYLALGLVAFSMICLKSVMINVELTTTSWFAYPPMATEIATAPLFYLYVKSLVTPSFSFKWQQLLHFIPFLVFQIYGLVIYMSVFGEDDLAEKSRLAYGLYYYPIKLVEDYLTAASIFTYLLIAFYKIRSYRERVVSQISDNSVTTLGWLYRLLQLSTLLGVVLFGNLLLDSIFNLRHSTNLHWQVFLFLNASFVYYFGFVGYSHRDLTSQENTTMLDIAVDVKNTKANKLPLEDVSKIAKHIERALTEKQIYLDPQLSLDDLAKYLQVNLANVSYVINSHFNKSFRELINQKRVEYVQHALVQKHSESSKKTSILALALDAGFNSEASFYRVFKNQTGLSPTAFIKSLQKTD
jgi:AraC-like DNA-binding protein